MICPVCAMRIEPDARRCQGCGTDLTEYLKVFHQADILFNDALSKIRRGWYAQAAELLCRAAGLRPDDEGILTLWAEAARLAGDPAEAVRILQVVLEQNDGAQTRALYERALQELELASASPDALIREAFVTERRRLEGAALRLEEALGRLEKMSAAEG